MRLSNLQLKNYKAISELDFVFPSEPGLYLLTGENKVDSDLGANGIGKSTIGTAITYLFYGVDPNKGVNTKDIRTWGIDKKKESFVELFDETVGEDEQGIKRSVPATMNQKGDYSKKLNGLPLKAFLNSVHFFQFGRFLFDLTPTEKTELLSEIIGLQFWDDCIDQAKKEYDNLIIEKDRLVRKSIEYKADKKACYSQLKEAKKEAEKRKVEKENLLKEAKGLLRKLKKKQERLSRNVSFLERCIKEGTKNVNRWEQYRTELMDEVIKFEQIKQEHEIIRGNINDSLVMYEKGVCSMCGKQLDEKTDLYKLEQLKAEKEGIQETIDGCVSEQDHYKFMVAEAEDDKEACLQDVRKKEDRLRKVKDMKRDVEYKIRICETEQIPQLKKEEDTKRTDTLIAKYKALRSAFRSSKKMLNSVEKKLQAIEYWKAKGFKTIKMDIIEQAVKRIEFEVNEVLITLGMEGWKVNIEYEYETGKGEKRKGFSVFVSNTYLRKSMVPWEAFSGGERQRIKIAGMIGLANVIDDEFNQPINFEFWDEPTTWLHEKGIESLVEMLKQRAREKEKVIFIADHRMYDSSVNTIRLERTQQGVFQV